MMLRRLTRSSATSQARILLLSQRMPSSSSSSSSFSSFSSFSSSLCRPTATYTTTLRPSSYLYHHHHNNHHHHPHLLYQHQQTRTLLIDRKGEEGTRYSQRTALSPYEVLAAKLGRFDRTLDALKVDAKGNVSEKQTSIKELLLNTEMHVRDLIALSPDSLHRRGGRLNPAILPRGDVIILVLHPLRLVITKDSCLALDAADPTIKQVINDIASAIKIQQLEEEHMATTEAGALASSGNYEVAYELIVLEQALRSFCDQFARIKELLSLITETSLQSMVDAEGTAQEEQLFKLVPLKDGLAVAQSNVQEAIDVLNQLLENDEDMLALLLTEKSKSSTHSNSKGTIQCLDPALHSEVELLLENYHRNLQLVSAQLKILQGRVQSAQEVFAINVDLYRNRVLRTTLVLTMISTSLASAATVGAFFGMNLPTGLEDHQQAFFYIVAGSLGLGAALFATAMAWTRGAGRDTLRKDLTSVSAYNNIFKHIRSVSQAIYQTSMDPTDVEMGNTKEFRIYFKDILKKYRGWEVSWQEVDVLLDVISRSAEQLRQQRQLSEDTSEEKIYRKLFESLATRQQQEISGGLGGMGGNGTSTAALAAGLGVGGEKKGEGEGKGSK